MNPLAEEITKLKDEIGGFEDKEKGLAAKEETIADILAGINRFCYDCPLNNTTSCTLCELNDWRLESRKPGKEVETIV